MKSARHCLYALLLALSLGGALPAMAQLPDDSPVPAGQIPDRDTPAPTLPDGADSDGNAPPEAPEPEQTTEAEGYNSADATAAEAAEEDRSPETTLYRIDLLVFANSDPAAEASEHWLPPKTLPLPAELRLLAPPNADGQPQPYARLPAVAADFASAAERMRRSRHYRVLLNESWLQPLPPGAPTPAIVLRGGQAYGAHHELEGSLELRRERFLHAHARLWLSRFGDAFDPETGDWPPLPLLPTAPPPADTDHDDDLEPVAAETATEAGTAPAEAMPSAHSGHADTATEAASTDDGLDTPFDSLFAPRPQRIVLIDQRRRLRSGEVHYLDHPLFGLILRITPQAASPASE